MACRKHVLLTLLCCLFQLPSCTFAALYNVGVISNGKWGAENYFQVGDSLSFSYQTRSAAMYRVSKEDYKACHVRVPIETYNDGHNVADLNEESTYYFISGVKSECMAGRKLIVVTLATSPGPSPSSAAIPSVATPPPTVETPAPTVASPSPSIATPVPSTASVPAPSTSSSPISTTPSTSTIPEAPASTPANLPTPIASAPTIVSSPASLSLPGPATSLQAPGPGSSATPPGLPAPVPALQPSSPSAASLGGLQRWTVASVSICNGLLLLL